MASTRVQVGTRSAKDGDHSSYKGLPAATLKKIAIKLKKLAPEFCL